MARNGHDEEDGWVFFAKTITSGVPDDEQLDVYARDVKWSTTSQLRSVVETDVGTEAIFDSLLISINETKIYSAAYVDRNHPAAKALAATANFEYAYLYRETAEDRSSLTGLYYRTVTFPWYVGESSAFSLPVINQPWHRNSHAGNLAPTGPCPIETCSLFKTTP